MPNSLFDGKYFNPEVFARYMRTIPETRKNALIRTSGIFAPMNELPTMMPDQTGGNYVKIPYHGLLKGKAQNYNGMEDAVPTTTDSYLQGIISVGRMKSFVERDFTMDITGSNIWEVIAAQIAEYYAGVDQDTLLCILKGLFSMSANDFTENHTYDISVLDGADAFVQRTTLNSATQQAAGDNKNIFTLCFMNSLVATSIENINATEYLKYTDANGVQRRIGLANWDDKLVIIDDNLPVDSVLTTPGTPGVYTVTVGTALTSGDSVTISAGSTGAKTYAFTSGTTSKTAQAAAIAELFSSDTVFNVSAEADKITFTQIVPGHGSIPTVDITDSTTGSVRAETTVDGVKSVYRKRYTTYVLGEGAFGYADLGVQVPYELERQASKHGGQTVLHTRQRKVFAPAGISFAMNRMATPSPTDEELEYGGNWELIHNGAENRETIDHKAIPILRILSLG